MFFTATYVSADEVERAEAFCHGYERVCQHPREVGRLEAHDVLVIDFNTVLFGETNAAIDLVRDSVRNGVPVGIHTYSPGTPVRILKGHPNVVVGKTHRHVRAKLRKLVAARPVAVATA